MKECIKYNKTYPLLFSINFGNRQQKTIVKTYPIKILFKGISKIYGKMKKKIQEQITLKTLILFWSKC
jgi:hypothetical protein